MLLPIKASWWTWCYSLLELPAYLNLERINSLVLKLERWNIYAFWYLVMKSYEHKVPWRLFVLNRDVRKDISFRIVHQLICILHENKWKIPISLSKERGHCCPFTREYWIAKGCLLTGQERACSRITQSVVCSSPCLNSLVYRWWRWLLSAL